MTTQPGKNTNTTDLAFVPGAMEFRAMQRHLHLAERLYPDWTHHLLKFHLRYAHSFQYRCESQVKRHRDLLRSPEYQQTAQRVWQLRQESRLWVNRRLGFTGQRTYSFDVMAESYLTTRRDQRNTVLYVEHFQARPNMLITSLIQPEFQAHDVEFPGLGRPDRWAYIEGLNKNRDDLRREVQSARKWVQQ